MITMNNSEPFILSTLSLFDLQRCHIHCEAIPDFLKEICSCLPKVSSNYNNKSCRKWKWQMWQDTSKQHFPQTTGRAHLTSDVIHCNMNKDGCLLHAFQIHMPVTWNTNIQLLRNTISKTLNQAWIIVLCGTFVIQWLCMSNKWHQTLMIWTYKKSAVTFSCIILHVYMSSIKESVNHDRWYQEACC